MAFGKSQRHADFTRDFSTTISTIPWNEYTRTVPHHDVCTDNMCQSSPVEAKSGEPINDGHTRGYVCLCSLGRPSQRGRYYVAPAAYNPSTREQYKAFIARISNTFWQQRRKQLPQIKYTQHGRRQPRSIHLCLLSKNERSAF